MMQHFNPSLTIQIACLSNLNLITLLVGASADGLQILTKQNEWVGVTSLPEQIVVNVGDMLQMWTRGEYKRNIHRGIKLK